MDSNDDDAFSGVRCHLTAWKIEEAPKYHAISYTWGVETLVGTIAVEGEATGVMGVRENLEDVLIQLLRFNTSKFYWIDALCISQSGLLEKAQQVAMMGSIFRNAEHVLVCLGPPDDDSEKSMRMISQRLERGIKRSVFDVLKSPDTPTKKESTSSPESIVSTPPPAWDSYAMSLAALSRRPYFSRVWVVQELILAKDASFCCGHLRISFEAMKSEISAACRYASAHHYLPDYDSQLTDTLSLAAAYVSTPSKSKYTIEQNCDRLLHLKDRSGWGKSTGSKFIPSGLLELLGGLQCEDPRDRIYGALALGLREYVKPNYSASLNEIAVGMLRHGLELSLLGGLVRCLDVDVKNSELQAAVSARYHQSIPRHPKMLQKELLEFQGRGRQLSSFCGTWTRKANAIEVKVHAPFLSDHDFDDTDLSLDVMVPLHAKEGDWVLTPDLAMPAASYDQSIVHRSAFGLLLRRTRDRFAIIGRVKHLSPPRSFEADLFRLMFHKQDFLVYLAFDKLPNNIDVRRWEGPGRVIVEKPPDKHDPFDVTEDTNNEERRARARRKRLSAEIASNDRRRRRTVLKRNRWRSI